MAAISRAKTPTGSRSAPRSGSRRRKANPRASVPAIYKLTFKKIAGKEAQRLADFVTIEKGLGPDGRVAVVRFDRGDGTNALSPEALRQLTDAARSFEDDSDTSAVVLTGGARAF